VETPNKLPSSSTSAQEMDFEFEEEPSVDDYVLCDVTTPFAAINRADDCQLVSRPNCLPLSRFFVSTLREEVPDRWKPSLVLQNHPEGWSQEVKRQPNEAPHKINQQDSDGSSTSSEDPIVTAEAEYCRIKSKHHAAETISPVGSPPKGHIWVRRAEAELTCAMGSSGDELEAAYYLSN